MRDAIKNVMARVFDISLEEISDVISTKSLTKWDSLAHIELVLALEMEFSVLFTSEEIFELLSLDDIEKNLQKKGISR